MYLVVIAGPDAGQQVALLNDLMLAKALEGVLAREVTGPGQLVGELAYMAPERTYSSMDIDCRSDLYGLGAMVYALLTGHPPFAGGSTSDLNSIKPRNQHPRVDFVCGAMDLGDPNSGERTRTSDPRLMNPLL